jgi:predicted RNA-binding protein
MCQMRVLFESKGREEVLLENVTLLEKTPEGLRISTLFEEPRLVKGVLARIDFLAGRVILQAEEEEHG